MSSFLTSAGAAEPDATAPLVAALSLGRPSFIIWSGVLPLVAARIASIMTGFGFDPAAASISSIAFF